MHWRDESLSSPIGVVFVNKSSLAPLSNFTVAEERAVFMCLLSDGVKISEIYRINGKFTTSSQNCSPRSYFCHMITRVRISRQLPLKQSGSWNFNFCSIGISVWTTKAALTERIFATVNEVKDAVHTLFPSKPKQTSSQMESEGF
jgi:hypothetical protein